MSMLFRLLAVTAVIWLGGVAQAAEPSSVPQAVASRAVVFPFDPPLDRAIVYQLSNSETRNGEPRTTTLEMTLQFRRDGDDYVLTLLHALPPGLPSAGPMAALILRPLELRISRAGDVLGLVDEPGYWAAIDSIRGDMIRQLGADAAGARMLDQLMRDMRAMPEQARINLIARNVIPLLDFAGTEMTPGEPIETSQVVETAFGPIERTIHVELEEVTGDVAHIRNVGRVSPEQVQALLRTLQERYAPQQAAEIPPMLLDQAELYRVSVRTGLSEYFESTISAAADQAGGSATRRTTIERIR